MPNDLQQHTEWDSKEHRELKLAVQKIDLALFGDQNGNIGMVAKVDEVHTAFTAGNAVLKFILKFIAAVGAIGAIVYTYLKIFKEWPQ